MGLDRVSQVLSLIVRTCPIQVGKHSPNLNAYSLWLNIFYLDVYGSESNFMLVMRIAALANVSPL